MACCSNLPYVLLLLLQSLLSTASLAAPAASGLFREYIGAEFKNVRLSDVPVHAGVDFHFILSFVIDYTTASPAAPTDGRFNVFWDAANLAPSNVLAVKRGHANAKVALSVGGDSVHGVHGDFAYFQPSSVDSWVSNAVSSLTSIIRQYHLDGIDIDYEHFKSDPDTFAECVGQLLVRLKRSGVVSFASIAPYANATVQSHYLALWNKYGHVIDYVNFQFYAYDRSTTVSQFLGYFEEQRSNYHGGRVLASFATDGTSGGLSPANGFFRGCRVLEKQGKLGGIFVWSADDSKSNGFRYEKQAQILLAHSTG